MNSVALVLQVGVVVVSSTLFYLTSCECLIYVCMNAVNTMQIVEISLDFVF